MSARSQISVPPRFSRRRTGRPVSRSIVCATISPRISCSVKFFEPTTIALRGPRGQARRFRRARPATMAAATVSAARRECVRRRGDRWRSSQQQRAVDDQRQERGGNRAGQDDRRVDHRQAAIDVLSESAGANRRRNRRRSDADDRRHANAGDDGRQRQRQLDLPQQLARRHAHRDAGFANRRSMPVMPTIVERTIGSSP